MRAHAIPNKVLFWILVIPLLISLIYFTKEGWNNAWIELNENQIMYLYSTSAQVVAAIFGLTLTGYIFFRGELNREAQNDPTLADSVNRLESRYFQQLAMITALVMATILFATLVIAYEGSKDIKRLTLFMNFGQCFFAASFITISFFIVDVVQPGNIKSASKALQEDIDPANGKERTGDLKAFASTYNSIEDQLTKLLGKLEIAAEPATSKNLSKIASTRIADILHSRKLISSDLLDKLKKLIALRNAILHGAEPMVSQSMVLESKLTLIQLLTEIETNTTKV